MYIQITKVENVRGRNSDGIEAKHSKESAPSEIQDSRSVLRRLKCSDLSPQSKNVHTAGSDSLENCTKKEV